MQDKPFALLLDEPRVGKTFTALAAAQQAGAKRVAVLGPAISREVWRRSAKDFGLTADLFVESYDRMVSQGKVREAIRSMRPDVLVLDEAHFLKSPDAKRTRYVYGDRRANGLKDYAGAIWGLTGTLIPNHLGEAWTHLYAAGRTARLYVPFLHRYCSGFETKYGWKVSGVREENVDEFLGLIRPISLRRRMRDLRPQLPKTNWNTMPLPGAAAAIRELHRLERELKLHALGEALERAGPDQVEEMLSDMALNTSQYQRLVSKAKAPAVVEFVKSLLDGGVDKVVVFGWFTETIEFLQEHLRDDYGAVMLYGETSERDRWARVDRFNTDPTCRAVIGNIRTMGTAIPLHAARLAVFADSSWSMGDMVQAGKRIISLDQTDSPEIILCSLAGTTDDIVAKAHAVKAEQAGVLNALEG